MQCSELTRGCRYEGIREACITQLLSALRNDTTGKKTWAKVCDVVDTHFKGDLEHVADTLSLLWQNANQVDNTFSLLWQTANQVDDIPVMFDGTPSVRLFLTPRLWSTLTFRIAGIHQQPHGPERSAGRIGEIYPRRGLLRPEVLGSAFKERQRL